MNKCKQCYKILTRKDNIYCNKSCYLLDKFYKSLQKFHLGKIKDNKTIKKILIFLEGDKCTKCSQDNMWNDSPLSLQVDHKDGNSDNNYPENLRLLCPNCHSQTSTFSGKKSSKKETKRNKYLRKYKGY